MVIPLADASVNAYENSLYGKQLNCTPFEYLPFNGVTDKVGLWSVGEERANLSASVYPYICGFCLERVPLPLGAWDGLRYFIVALPEPSINYFAKSLKTRFFLHLIRAKSIELRKRIPL